VDLPGHGRSAGELLDSIAAMADWLGGLIEALRVPAVHLVGHSMGALIGLELAARHRKRIARLALLGAAPKMPVHPALLEAAARSEPLAPALICDWGFGPAGHFGGHKAPGSWMLGHALRLLGRSAGARLHVDLTACNDYRDGPQAAAGVRCPTLVIAGAADRMTPARHAAALAETIKGAQLVVLPACGHMMMVEQPDAALDALLAFLAQ
jgi:pimeloyl-ACP methyl ester carboxylesterase